jgi:membrane-bound lytic murein transglycosylase F
LRAFFKTKNACLTNAKSLVKKAIFLILILVAGLISCSDDQQLLKRNNIDPFTSDLDSIRQRGRLIAVTDINSTNYFVYKGEPMGFHYELLKAFTDHLGVDLELIAEDHLENALDLLKSCNADILAIGLTVNSARKKEILFSDPIIQTRQVLVQRKPFYWRSITSDALNRLLIRNQLDLAGKTIFVQENSSHYERLMSLSAEIGENIEIVEVAWKAEELIRNVANGEIDYAVCDENVARVNSTYYTEIDVGTPVSFPQNIAWGLRKESSQTLLNELNSWISSYKKSRSFALVYAKYFRNSRSNNIVKNDYYSLNTGKISRWDDLIKSASNDIGWDWRLLASLIYQESRFKPDVQSRAGAYGLMQVMPLTAKKLGINIKASPVSNIKAGTMYIDWLQSVYEPLIADEKERMKFVLASYNAGPGHILDAMKLAEKNGKDPHIWDENVEVWMLKKSDPVYYNDIVVKSGYFRGTESVNFVAEVLERYEHYKNLIPEDWSQRLTMNSGNNF